MGADQAVHMAGGLLPAGGLVVGVLALAFCFAKVEIQIEGPDGWAAALPTWRVERHPLLNLLWGGRPLTGYHLWAFVFMFLVFHLPHLVAWRFEGRLEVRILGALALFWVAEDFLWFLLNPAYGWRRFRPENVWWHRHWAGRVPVDYVVHGVLAAAAIGFSYA